MIRLAAVVSLVVFFNTAVLLASKRWGRFQSAAFALRAAAVFVGAHLIWASERSAGFLVSYLFVAPILQMVVTLTLHSKGKI